MWQAPAPSLVLASNSRTRAALLEAAGLSFERLASGLDEAVVKAQAASVAHGTVALRLAEMKARLVSDRRPDALVIGADQVLSADGIMFGKPATRRAAREQLGRLRGRSQTLHTAVVLARQGGIVWRHVCAPMVSLRQASDRLLDLYVER